MDPHDLPNLLFDCYDPDLHIPPRFDEYDSGREDQRAETRRVDTVWREVCDRLASVYGAGAPAADALEMLIHDLPPGHIRWRLRLLTSQYRRGERKKMREHEAERRR